MTSAEFRSNFLNYFKTNGHEIIQSSSVIPWDDPTLLFTNAGMNQFKDLLLGNEKQHYTCAASVQKCIRAGGKHNDLDEVGKDNRHLTFFEMLGNWSFGDYYKREAITLAWDYVTKHLQLPTKLLYATVDCADDTAFSIWKNDTSISNSHIIKLGDATNNNDENFWAMGPTGPCGFCSEIFIDQGPLVGCKKNTCAVGCDCDRYLEFWNLVFMEFNRDESGQMVPLAFQSVDTGMGLERVQSLLNAQNSIYKTDLFLPIIDHLSQISKCDITNTEHYIATKVIADHIRSLSFALADGATFSNEGRGYVLRRILRRAVRHGRNIGLHEPFMGKILPTLQSILSSAYPELNEKASYIKEQLYFEEERFFSTIDRGLRLFDSVIADLKTNKQHAIPGKIAFQLYDTHGFPLDLTTIIAEEHGLSVDIDGYNLAMSNQQSRARKSMKFHAAHEENWTIISDRESHFIGYSARECDSTIIRYRFIESSKTYDVILDQTPFYAESGGQIGDIGKFHLLVHSTASIDIDVLTTTSSQWGPVHSIQLPKDQFESLLDKQFRASVDSQSRSQTMKHHTATHLLHWALRKTLGDSVHQAGSLVTPSKLRFDFNYHKQISKDDLKLIELLVNDKIQSADSVEILTNVPIDDAKAMGAMALFGEKYRDHVRVVKSGDYSLELCGGTHVTNTGAIGPFIIVKEEGVAAGIRRIEALVGHTALERISDHSYLLTQLENELSVNRDDLFHKIQDLIRINKKLKADVSTFKSKRLTNKVPDILTSSESIGNTHFLTHHFDEIDRNTLRNIGDTLKEKLKSGYIILTSGNNDHYTIIAMATVDVTAQLSADELLKGITSHLGGKGGGNATMAQGMIPANTYSRLKSIAHSIISHAH